MVDVFEHSARLDTAAVEERRDLVQIIPDGGKLPCDGFNFVRVDIEHIRGTRLQENGRMNWLEQVHQMKDRDIRTIEQHELQELPQDAVEHGLPQEERLKNLLDKVRNPYCYLDNGIIVKLNFAPRGSSTLSERIGRCFQSAS